MNARLHATRFFLLAELTMAVLLFITALAGGLLYGGLQQQLAVTGQNLAWGLVFGAVALAHGAVVGIEVAVGRRWDDSAVMRSCGFRSAGLFMQFICWLYAVFFILTAPGPVEDPALLLTGLFFLPLTVLAFIANRRAYALLNPEIPTTNYERTIVMHTNRLHRG